MYAHAVTFKIVFIKMYKVFYFYRALCNFCIDILKNIFGLTVNHTSSDLMDFFVKAAAGLAVVM